MAKQPPQVGEIWSAPVLRDSEEKMYLTILDHVSPNSRIYTVMELGVIRKEFIVFESDEWQKVA